jgi:hypothetical protein
LPGGIRKTTKTISQDGGVPGRDSNRAPSEYKAQALLLNEPIRVYLPQISLKISNVCLVSINQYNKALEQAYYNNVTRVKSQVLMGLNVKN